MTDDMDELNGKRTSRLEIYVSPELEDAINRRAEKDIRKVSHYVCKLLLEHELMMRDQERAGQVIPSPRAAPLRPVRVTAPFDDESGERVA